MKDVDSEKSGTRDVPPNFVTMTEYISPLERQLLKQQIRLANLPADTENRVGVDREMQKLNVLEHLVEVEQANNPPYAVTRLLDMNDAFKYEDDFADDDFADGDFGDEDSFIDAAPPVARAEAQAAQDEKPSGLQRLGSRLLQACGLDDPWADLLEERLARVTLSDTRGADAWFIKQVLVSTPPLFPKVVWRLARSLAVAVIKAAALNALLASLTSLLTAWLAEIARRIAH